jgi:NitT/TauT family transport system substrate-binding protein
LIVPLLNMRKGRYRVLVHYKDVLPAQTGNVGVTERSFAKAHPAEIKAIVAGRRAAVQAIYAEPKSAAASLAKFLSIPEDIALETTDQMVEAKMWSEGAFNIEELDRAADGLRLVGEIKETVDWSTIIERSYLPPDLQNA